MHTFRSTGIAALIAGTVLVTSCGVGTVEVKGRSKAADAVATTLAAGPTTTRTPPDTTTAPTTTVPTTSAPAAAPSSGDRSDQAFCAAAGRVLNSGLDSIQHFDMGDKPDVGKAMDNFKAWMTSVDEIVTAMDATAPAAIAEDMHTVAVATHKSVAALQSAGNFGDMMGSDDIMGDADSAAASERVARYTMDHCGFSLTDKSGG